MSERAITLKEAAELLNVSYWTVYEHRISLGFFKVGGCWRIWPQRLTEMSTGYNERRPAQADERGKKWESESAKAPMPGISTSARQAAVELDKLLAHERRILPVFHGSSVTA